MRGSVRQRIHSLNQTCRTAIQFEASGASSTPAASWLSHQFPSSKPAWATSCLRLLLQQQRTCSTRAPFARVSTRLQPPPHSRWFATSAPGGKPPSRAPIAAPPRATAKAANADIAAAAAQAAANSGPVTVNGFKKWWSQFQSVPNVPKWLGLTGIIPFIAFAPPVAKNLRGILPDEAIDNAAAVQVGYGVTILSFLGAVHWGLAMSTSLAGPVGARIANAGFIWSVVPSLMAWPLTAMEPAPASLLLTMFVPMVYLVDHSRRNLLPVWYMALRLPLTLGATFGCLLTATYYMHLEYDRVEAAKQQAAAAAGGGGAGSGAGSAASSNQQTPGAR